MENASKALIMAAGVLITMLIVSLLIFARNRVADYYNSDKDIEDISDVTKFNLQFTNYERDDVKGVELISLSNKIADYNFRHSNAEDAKNDEGYQFITLKINIESSNESKDPFAYGDDRKLYTSTSYTQSGASNVFSLINNQMYEAENKYGKKNLRNLAKAIFTVFPKEELPTETQKYNSVKKFKEITASKEVSGEDPLNIRKVYDDIKNCDLDDATQVTDNYNTIKNTFKEISIKYYEYTQFKKAIFKHVSTQYSDNGRIKYMEFNFMGRIE